MESVFQYYRVFLTYCVLDMNFFFGKEIDFSERRSYSCLDQEKVELERSIISFFRRHWLC